MCNGGVKIGMCPSREGRGEDIVCMRVTVGPVNGAEVPVGSEDLLKMEH